MASRNLAALAEMANKLRLHSVEMTTAAGSGHPTSCASIAEILSVLFFDSMKYTVQEPLNPNNDRFILSKGHAAPILYAAWAEAGLFPKENLLNLRKISSDLEGHPTPRLSFVEVGTGSLGQGLSVGAGQAYAGKYMEKDSKYRVYVLLGDGESAEGSVWEALAFCSHYKLDNICAIFDVNRLGQSEATMLGHDVDTYKARLEAFGWHTIVVDGHNVGELAAAFDSAASIKGKPVALVAKTFKGKGLADKENADGAHGKPIQDDGSIANAIRGLIKGEPTPAPRSPDSVLPAFDLSVVPAPEPPAYNIGDKVATRAAYGTVLVKLGHASNRIVACDAETKNSTMAIDFRKEFPDRFCECFIAEQNLVGVGIGLSTRGKIPFLSTFAAFFSRAFDQIRMAGVSRNNVKYVGSHVGVSIGEDGPSQMGLEDLAMFRSIPGALVLYPSDAVSAERAVHLAANWKGPAFVRTSRPATPVIYANDEVFEVGKAKVVRQSNSDRVTIVAAGVTLVEATKAADELAGAGLHARIIDPISIKPIDAELLIASAKETGNVIVTVEDHYPEGGLGDAVAAAVSTAGVTVHKLAVTDVPRSGKADELLDMFGISARHIVAKVKEAVLA